MNNEKILFKCLVGSKLYGTDNENSDTDIKGVFLPNKRDLLLGKAPKHYTSSTGNDGMRNDKEDIDETYYSLHYFLELAAKGETNAIDLLFAYTNENAIILKTDIWDKLIQNIDKIITRNVKAYLGYCKSQCVKYSLKGDKLNNFKKFDDFCMKYIYDDHTNIKNLLNTELGGDVNNWKIYDYIPKPNEDRIKFTNIDFGDHCYFITAWNGESYISISDIKIDLNDTVQTAHQKMKKAMSSYGKRAELAAKENGADYKAISHCVRVLLQVEQLLNEHKITFPLKEVDFIKSIKFHTTNMSYEEIMNWIENKIKYIDEKLLPNSTLREKADYKWIDEFILSCY